MFFFGSFVGFMNGQVDNSFDFGDEEPLIIEKDTSVSDTMKIVKNSFFEIFKGKPGKAALLSLVIPSGGQVYNKKWWKVPLALGIDGVTGYLIYYNSKQYKEFDGIYKDLLNGIEDNKYGLTTSNASVALNQRNVARQNREYSWVAFIIGHIVTVFDAYVDRHLMTFDVSDDLSFNFYSKQTNSPAIAFAIPLYFYSDKYHIEKAKLLFP
jgi:hypothetical protein